MDGLLVWVEDSLRSVEERSGNAHAEHMHVTAARYEGMADAFRLVRERLASCDAVSPESEEVRG